jgi:hypothetical protein
MVEDDFVMVDPDAEDRKVADSRPNRLNRQIEEGVYNIKPEDYNEAGELKAVVAVVLEKVKGNLCAEEESKINMSSSCVDGLSNNKLE